MKMTINSLKFLIREEVARSILRENAEPMRPNELKSFLQAAKEIFKNESEKIISTLSNSAFYKAFGPWGLQHFQYKHKRPRTTASDFKNMIDRHTFVLFVWNRLTTVLRLYHEIKSSPEDIRSQAQQELNRYGEQIFADIKEFRNFQKNIEMLDDPPDNEPYIEDIDLVTASKESVLASLEILADLYKKIEDQLISVSVGLEDPEHKEQRRIEKLENRFHSGRHRIRG